MEQTLLYRSVLSLLFKEKESKWPQKIKTLSGVIIGLVMLGGVPATAGHGHAQPGGGFQPPAPSSRELRVVIRYNDQEFRGGRNHGGNLLMLKRDIRFQNPRIRLQEFKLVSVRLIAKSKMGRGMAELLIDGQGQDRVNIGGTPSGFYDPSPRTFARPTMNNYNRRAQGRWQVSLRGNIIVRKVVVMLKRRGRGPGPGPGRVIELGDDKADKIIADRKTFNANVRGVTQIKIQGTKNLVEILSVEVRYFNGRVESFPQMQGMLFDGSTRTVYLRYRNVQSVIVTATSPNPFGSRGKYKVSVVGSRR